MSEGSIHRHMLFFIWLALCIELYRGTAQYGDPIHFHGTSILHFPSVMVQKEKKKAQVAYKGCIGLLHDGIMTRVPQ